MPNVSPQFIEELYLSYKKNPSSVENGWRQFFQGYEFSAASEKKNLVSSEQSSVEDLIKMYRHLGHLVADLNPIVPHKKIDTKTFSLEKLGFSAKDKDAMFNATELGLGEKSTLREVEARLKEIYCSKNGYEFIHCSDEVQRWILGEIEGKNNSKDFFDSKQKKNLLEMTIKATLLEDFLQKKYGPTKRFGLEGAESIILGLDTMIRAGVKKEGVKEFVFGMAHRGRLNVLVNVLKKSYDQLFIEFEGGQLSENIDGDGDVKYHLGQSTDVEIDGKKVHLSLAFNPSHLEAVNPVVEGIVQAKAIHHYQKNSKVVVPVLIHGDAAVVGQGVIYELANLSKMPGYDNAGTIHIILDNQVGFTANSEESRAAFYPSNVAKLTDSPVFHANGDDVEAVARVFDLAMHFRQRFAMDVWINIICFRKRGHNEGDDPFFTQPHMYKIIDKHPGLLPIYKKQLQNEKLVSEDECLSIENRLRQVMENSLNAIRKIKKSANKLPAIQINTLQDYWKKIRPSNSKDFEQSVSTGSERSLLDDLMKKLLEIPNDFNIYFKLKKILDARKNLYFEKKTVNWAIAEQLAFATILHAGQSVRITGQDSSRSTFGHRHAIFRDTEQQKLYCPLEKTKKGSAEVTIINSQLSEYSILGFEYGYSLISPYSLVIWEAQFGDFANGAQIIIDQFISSGETKWQRNSGVVLLLPHGYAGQGPEHSSARLERFLQLCAAENMFVVNITTPANFFHVLRRQVIAPFRKPLIVMSPKSLLRKVMSPIDDLVGKDARFQEILDDDKVQPHKVTRVLLCSGKIYYELLEKREQLGRMDVAIVRFEQLYPINFSLFEKIRKKYNNVSEWFWVQEEPANMGAWLHINFYICNRNDLKLKLIAGEAAASPAKGMLKAHEQNQEKILTFAFAVKTKK